MSVLLLGCGPRDTSVPQGADSPFALHEHLLAMGGKDAFALRPFFAILHPSERAGFARFTGWLPFKAQGRFDLEDPELTEEQGLAWVRALEAHKKVLEKYGLDKVEEAKGNPGGALSPMQLLGRGLPRFDGPAFVEDSWAVLNAEPSLEVDLTTPAALQRRIIDRVPELGAQIKRVQEDVAVIYNESDDPLMVFRRKGERWFVTFERPPVEPAKVGPREAPPKPESDK